jgi:putative tryptophan/tyrosine transport system substrate-binding protein
MRLDHSTRRNVIALIGSAGAWPLLAHGQQAMPVVGFLHAGFAAGASHALMAFRQGLAAADYDEGRNVALEFRYAQGQVERLPELARELARSHVAIIAAFGNLAARAAKAVTTTIPVVFAGSADPVAVGLVSSLNRPGANMTGVSILNQELESIRLERLVEVVPHAATIAYLINPDSVTASAKLREMDSAAQMLGRRMQVLHARGEREFEAAFATAEQQQIGAMIVVSDTVFSNESADLGRVSARHTVPTMGAYGPFTRAGGLMSYGTDLREAYRRVGACVARILKGEKPADMPVQQSTKVEFVINSKTADALGLKIPPQLLAIADEVIQ